MQPPESTTASEPATPLTPRPAGAAGGSIPGPRRAQAAGALAGAAVAHRAVGRVGRGLRNRGLGDGNRAGLAPLRPRDGRRPAGCGPDAPYAAGGLPARGGRVGRPAGRALLAAKVRRAAYALDRRLAVWQPTAGGGRPYGQAGDGVRGDARRLSACLDAVDALTRGGQQGRAWNEYLTLDSLRPLADGRSKSDDDRRAAATAALRAACSHPDEPAAAAVPGRSRWPASARSFAAGPPGRANIREHHRARRTVRAGPAVVDGRLVAEDCRRLAMSSPAVERQLAESLEGYYRNANAARGRRPTAQPPHPLSPARRAANTSTR